MNTASERLIGGSVQTDTMRIPPTHRFLKGRTHENLARHSLAHRDLHAGQLAGRTASRCWRCGAASAGRSDMGVSRDPAAAGHWHRPEHWRASGTACSDGRYRTTCWIPAVAPSATIHPVGQTPLIPSAATRTRGEPSGIRMTISPPSRVQVIGLLMAGLLFFLASLRAQHVPRNVWAEVFAADSAIGGALDQGAAFSRNPAFAGLPLAQQRRGDSKLFGQLGLGARLGSKVVGQVHVDRV